MGTYIKQLVGQPPERVEMTPDEQASWDSDLAARRLYKKECIKKELAKLAKNYIDTNLNLTNAHVVFSRLNDKRSQGQGLTQAEQNNLAAARATLSRYDAVMARLAQLQAVVEADGNKKRLVRVVNGIRRVDGSLDGVGTWEG